MAKYLAVYIGTATDATKAAQPISPASEAAGMAAWGQWATDNASVIVDQGAPLGRTKKVDKNGISDTRNQLTGYVIIEAASLDAAAAIFRSHPHFSMFPGDSVEIIECLAMPG